MIYLLRHGLDNEKYIGGWSDVDLTSKGIAQANKASIYIKNNLSVDCIYSSDIKRAIQTAEIISQNIGVEAKFQNHFRELNKGLLNGLENLKAQKLYPDYFSDLTIHTKYPNGESMIGFYNRVKNFLDKLLTLDNSLIITHRGFINMIYFILNDRQPDMNKSQFNVTHASLHELDPVRKKIKRIYYEPYYSKQLFWSNGNIKRETLYYKNKKHGLEKHYRKDGTLEISIDYDQNMVDGYVKTYYTSGLIESKQLYRNGEKASDLTIFNEYCECVYSTSGLYNDFEEYKYHLKYR